MNSCKYALGNPSTYKDATLEALLTAIVIHASQSNKVAECVRRHTHKKAAALRRYARASQSSSPSSEKKSNNDLQLSNHAQTLPKKSSKMPLFNMRRGAASKKGRPNDTAKSQRDRKVTKRIEDANDSVNGNETITERTSTTNDLSMNRDGECLSPSITKKTIYHVPTKIYFPKKFMEDDNISCLGFEGIEDFSEPQDDDCALSSVHFFKSYRAKQKDLKEKSLKRVDSGKVEIATKVNTQSNEKKTPRVKDRAPTIAMFSRLEL
jgi:hypothetical protein